MAFAEGEGDDLDSADGRFPGPQGGPGRPFPRLHVFYFLLNIFVLILLVLR